MASNERPPQVVIPHLRHGEASEAEHQEAVTRIADENTTVDLLGAVDNMGFASVLALSAVVDQLTQRRRDVDELLSIAKSASELSRKVQRLANRLLHEDESNGG